MIKKIIICFFVFFQFKLTGQSIYLKTGKNYTNFKFISSDGSLPVIQKGVGDSYQLGYGSLVIRDFFSYEIGMVLNEYKAMVGTVSNYISWNVHYLGIQNTILYSFFDTNQYNISGKVGVGVSKIVYGKQEFNGIFYDIKKTDDFKSLLFQYAAGLEARYNLGEEIKISLAYDFINSLNASKATDSKFFINSGQISVGVYFTN